MRYADEKDIKRAKSLGIHSGAVRMSQNEIAEGKASSMAKAITDKRKILGRLEAVASEWKNFDVIFPFIEKCLVLWPNSEYVKAYNLGISEGVYFKKLMFDLSVDSRNGKKGLLISESGNLFFSKIPYNFDPVALIIFNTMYRNNCPFSYLY